MARLAAIKATRGTPAAAAVGATLAALSEAEVLPGLLDSWAAIPPTGKALVRRVAGRNVWIYYRVEGAEVWLLNVSTNPPVLVHDDDDDDA